MQPSNSYIFVSLLVIIMLKGDLPVRPHSFCGILSFLNFELSL